MKYTTIYDILDQDWLRDKLTNKEYSEIEHGHFDILCFLFRDIEKKLERLIEELNEEMKMCNPTELNEKKKKYCSVCIKKGSKVEALIDVIHMLNKYYQYI